MEVNVDKIENKTIITKAGKQMNLRVVHGVAFVPIEVDVWDENIDLEDATKLRVINPSLSTFKNVFVVRSASKIEKI